MKLFALRINFLFIADFLLFALYFNLILFYIELCFGFWITWILKTENPKIESFPPSADLILNNIYIYIRVCVCVCVLFKHKRKNK